MSVPRLITADEVLADRAEQNANGSICSHQIVCDCPACRNASDPTGKESAAYLNMDYPSAFNGLRELPSFAASTLAKESYLANAGPGFYIGSAKKAATLADVILVITPPLALHPARILHIAENGIWDEFFLYTMLDECVEMGETMWWRRTYVDGRRIESTAADTAIPFAALPARLQELFG